MAAASDYTSIDAPDGTPIFVPTGVHDDLSEDQIEALRYDGVVVRQPETGEYDIVWAFWKGQIDAIEAVYSQDYDIVGFVGGYRSGKSVTGARLTIEVCLNPAFRPARTLAMGKTFAEAKKTTYPVLFEEIPGDDLDPYLGAGDPENSPLIANFSKQDGVITWVTGSTTILASADKPKRYEGGKFSFAWLDEVAHYGNGRDDIHGIRKTVGERFDLGPPACQLWTTTGNGFNAAYDTLERGVEVDPGGDETPIGQKVTWFRGSSFDNPFLTREDRQRLRRVWGGAKTSAQALHGEFEAAEGLVYNAFSRQSHVVTVAEDGSLHKNGKPMGDSIVEGRRFYGYDAGWDNPMAVVEVGETNYGQFVALDEYYQSGKHVEHAIDQWFDAKDKDKGPVYCEHEPSDIARFRRAGWRAGKAKKDVDAGIRDVRFRFEEDAKGKVGLLIADTCEHLIKELHGYTEDDVGASDAQDHLLDALRYAIHTHVNRSNDDGSSTHVSKA